MKRQLTYSPELAGVRGLAALLVCLYHYLEEMTRVPDTAGIIPRALSIISARDYITVDVFFVLSGFLITSLLLADKEKPHYFYNFYWRRVLRIVPVFLITMLIFWHSDRGVGRYLVLCFLFIANFSKRFGIPYLSPLWTLCIEEQFYLVWPQVVRRCTITTITWISVALIALSTLLRALYLFQLPIDNGYTWCRLDGLGYGVLAACIFMTNKEELTPGLRRVMAFLTSDTLLYIAVAGFLILPVYPKLSDFTQMFCSIALTNYLMFRFIYAVTVNGRRFPVLASKPMLFMGSISYAFYMFHTFVIHHFTIQHGQPNPMHLGPFLGRMALIYAITIAASTASQYLVEKPAQRLRRYVLARPSDIRESMALQIPHDPAAYHRKLT